jgi:hypothetical protein
LRRGDTSDVDIQLAKRIATFGLGLGRHRLEDGALGDRETPHLRALLHDLYQRLNQ